MMAREKNSYLGILFTVLDMGEVIAIIRAKETVEKQDLLVVSYDGIEVTYQRPDLNQITLAYCCSIHKSQGSEFQTVIMPVVRGYSKMLRRNLLYTGITRAKNFLILCGESDVLATGLMKTDDLLRYTSLKTRLNSELIEKKVEEKEELVVSEEQPIKASEAIVQNNEVQLSLLNNSDSHKIGESLPMHLTVETAPYIHPLIGMDDVSPYDFND